MTNVLLAITACPTPESAEILASALVSEGLAACVNQLPGVQSTYMWQGKLQRDSEILLLIKTAATQFEALETRLKALHPYELPELVAVPVTAGSEAYLYWVCKNVAPTPEPGAD
jgi:periplasmic divalent cation tolerance protein